MFHKASRVPQIPEIPLSYLACLAKILSSPFRNGPQALRAVFTVYCRQLCTLSIHISKTSTNPTLLATLLYPTEIICTTRYLPQRGYYGHDYSQDCHNCYPDGSRFKFPQPPLANFSSSGINIFPAALEELDSKDRINSKRVHSDPPSAPGARARIFPCRTPDSFLVG